MEAIIEPIKTFHHKVLVKRKKEIKKGRVRECERKRETEKNSSILIWAKGHGVAMVFSLGFLLLL